jgi:signal transduction histidine kinase
LGLQIARGVAEAHGGQLAIESRPGEGTKVTLWVPVEPAAKLEAAA